MAQNQEVELIDINNKVPILRTQMSLVPDQKRPTGVSGEEILDEDEEGPPEPLGQSVHQSAQPEIP